MVPSGWELNADLAKLFGSAQHIMVTEDSAMMISEAISSGNLVTTIYPKVINSPSRYDNQIQHYLNRGFMSRSSMEAIISLDFNRKNSSALIEGVQKQPEKYNRKNTVVISTQKNNGL